MDPEEAWQEVFGRAPKGKQAQLLATDSDVAVRICDVQDRIVDQTNKATVLNKAWALDILGRSITEAFAQGKFATAIRGVELVGRLPEMQLFPNQAMVRHTHDHYAHMSEKEILEAAIELKLIKPREQIVEGDATRVESGDGSNTSPA